MALEPDPGLNVRPYALAPGTRLSERNACGPGPFLVVSSFQNGHDRKMRPIRSSHPSALNARVPAFNVICGDALHVLRDMPAECVDMCMTSPPYWGHREYEVPGIGQEQTFAAYVSSLTEILREVKRVLKPSGSLWLNIGDSYDAKTWLAYRGGSLYR